MNLMTHYIYASNSGLMLDYIHINFHIITIIIISRNRTAKTTLIISNNTTYCVINLYTN